jgi:soluble lytic murein transglycosylase-like protein
LCACASAPEPAGSSVRYEPVARPRDAAGARAPIPGCARFEPLVRDVAAEAGLDPGLLVAIATLESRWRPGVESRAGARGLMQIMPSTGRRLGCGDLFAPAANLRCGARLLRRLLDRYQGAVDYALSAYAIGARKPDRAFAEGSPPPRQSFIRRVQAARKRWLDWGCA